MSKRRQQQRMSKRRQDLNMNTTGQYNIINYKEDNPSVQIRHKNQVRSEI